MYCSGGAAGSGGSVYSCSGGAAAVLCGSGGSVCSGGAAAAAVRQWIAAVASCMAVLRQWGQCIQWRCCGSVAAVAGVLRQCSATVAAVLRQVVVRFAAQEPLYSGRREMRMRKMCFPTVLYTPPHKIGYTVPPIIPKCQLHMLKWSQQM